jgi:hypothetical protein
MHALDDEYLASRRGGWGLDSRPGFVRNCFGQCNIETGFSEHFNSPFSVLLHQNLIFILMFTTDAI